MGINVSIMLTEVDDVRCTRNSFSLLQCVKILGYFVRFCSLFDPISVNCTLYDIPHFSLLFLSLLLLPFILPSLLFVGINITILAVMAPA